MRALTLLFLGCSLSVFGQVAIVSNSSYVRAQPNGQAAFCYHAEAGDSLVLIEAASVDGYYHVRAPGGCSGYVYRNRVRLREVDPPAWASGGNSGTTPPATPGVPRLLKACTFNIKFIGQGSNKQYQPLADLLGDYDLVLVQELVSAPIDHTFDGVLLPATTQSRAFFDLMATKGFAYALSSEKTGPTDNRHNNSQSEWFVAFYKDNVLHYDEDRSDFVDRPLVRNSTFDRIPWSFHFTTTDATLDFTITSVHLAADVGKVAQRRDELASIAQHVANDSERDQLIVGDMNIQSSTELQNVLPAGYTSLNAACVATNVGSTGKPFDHLMYRDQFTGADLDRNFFLPLDLVTIMRSTWDTTDGPYPGEPGFNVSTYGSYFSDHEPVEFHLIYGVHDDD